MRSSKFSLSLAAASLCLSVSICGSGTADAAPAVAHSVSRQHAVVVTDKYVTINGVRYSHEGFQRLLDAALAKEQAATGSRGKEMHAAFAPALAAGLYFVPGVGEVLLAASGTIIIAGVTIWGAGWLGRKIKNYLANFGQAHEISDARKALPGYIKNSNGNVDMGKFRQKVRGSKDRQGPNGWSISPDRDGHRGSKWKVLDPKGKRKASVKDNGEVVGK